MIAVLCNEAGETLLGLDGVFHVDGRLTVDNRLAVVHSYREAFRKHFAWKVDHWSHVMFVQSVRDLPDSYNRRPMPHRFIV